MIDLPPSHVPGDARKLREANARETAHILLVDDNAAGRYALRRHLEREGFDIAEAGDGATALNLLAATPIDLVILDVNLPDMTGFEVCRRLRAAPATRRIPVLQLSATAIDAASQVVGLESGADAYLVEPVDRSVLVATVHALLRAGRAERAAEDGAREWQATFDAITGPVCLLDADGLVARCNAAFCILLGCSAPSGDCIGRPFEQLIDPDAASPQFRRVAALRAGGGREVAEGVIGGRWHQLVLDPIRDDRGRLTGVAATLTDLEERRHAEVELEKAFAKERQLRETTIGVNRLLEAIVKQLPVALLVADAPSRRIVIANEQVERVWRRPLIARARADDYGEWPGFGTDGTPYDATRWPLNRALETGETVDGEEIEIERGDGTRGVITMSAGPVRDESGHVVAGVATFADITARWESDALRDTFISVLSHELRTPITTIYAGTRLLLKDSSALSAETRHEVLDDVASEAERLERLVENLLVLVRIERGVASAEREPVLIQRLLDRVVADEQRRWPATRFEIVMPPDLPSASADEALVELIARNLLSNAAKYGPPRGVVTVTAEAGEGEIVVRVLDRGPGIARGQERDIFRVFYRAKETAAIAAGAGIGLFIVRSLAEQMRGRVWAVNRPDGGAEFGLVLPVFEE